MMYLADLITNSNNAQKKICHVLLHSCGTSTTQDTETTTEMNEHAYQIASPTTLMKFPTVFFLISCAHWSIFSFYSKLATDYFLSAH